MDIKLFSRIIKDMLASDERASVPNFGTFSVVEMPATFSDKGFTVNPPYYRIDFTPSVGDDGEFLRLYSSSNGISLQKAEKLLAQFLSDFKNELFDKKAVTMPELGRLKVASGNFLVFVQNEDLKILPRLDCLEPVSLKSRQTSEDNTAQPVAPVHEEEPAPVVEKISPVKEPEPAAAFVPVRKPVVTAKAKNSAWKWALIILAVIIVLLGALAIIGRLCPDLIDPWLYSQEEYLILKTSI